MSNTDRCSPLAMDKLPIEILEAITSHLNTAGRACRPCCDVLAKQFAHRHTPQASFESASVLKQPLSSAAWSILYLTAAHSVLVVSNGGRGRLWPPQNAASDYWTPLRQLRSTCTITFGMLFQLLHWT